MSKIKGQNPKRNALAYAVLIAMSGQAVGQVIEQDLADEDNLETVIVVGSTTNVDISAIELQQRQASDLEDVFRSVPSVSVGGSIGIAQKVYIRGLEDTLLNITVDGAPQTGTLFHHIGRVSIEPELLKQVELQAGAGEATSGFGAIGGAIRFHTVDAEDLLDVDEDFGGIFKVSYFDNDASKSSKTVYGRLDENWSVLGSLVDVNRDNTVDGSGDLINGSNAEQSLSFVKLSGNFENTHEFKLSHERRVEHADLGVRPNWPVFADDPLVTASGRRETIVANYQYSPDADFKLELTAYNTATEFERDNPSFGEYRSEISTRGFDVRGNSVIADHDITYGVERREDTVIGQYITFPELGDDVEESGEAWAVYAQDHYQVTEPLILSFGLRYDDYDMEQLSYDDHSQSSGLSVNLGAEYQINAPLSLTVGYAEALRGKEVGDGFTLEQYHGTDSLADNLEPETVENIEIGLEFDNNQFKAGLSYYDMTINDVILDQLGDSDGRDAESLEANVYYENIGELKSEGFEANIGTHLKQVAIELAFVTNDTKINDLVVEGYEHIGLANSVGDTWTLNLSYEPADDVLFTWDVRHVEALNNIEVLHRGVELGWIDSVQYIDKPEYTVHDFSLSFKFLEDEAMTVGLTVQNVFNATYLDHSSVGDYTAIPDWSIVRGVNEAGRDVRLSAAYTF